MTDATDSTDQMDALTTAGKYFGDETTRAAQDTAAIMKDVLFPSIVANEGALLRSAESANELNNAFRTIQISDVATNAIAIATETAKTGIKEITEALKAANFDSDAIKEYTRLLEESKGVGTDGFSVLGEAYDANFTRYVEEIATTQTEFAEISKKLEDNAGSMTTLIDEFKNKGGQMARIADALEKGETVQISLQLDGKTIAKSTQAYFKGTGQAIVLTAKE